MTRLALAIALAFTLAGALTAAGGAREAASFACPKNPAAGPSTLWVKNYQGFRGSTWCSDGATASVHVNVAPGELNFTGGLCTQTRNGSLYLQVGTRISPADKRKSTDPPGLFLNNPKPSTGLDRWLDVGTPKFRWAAKVTIAWNGLKGSFSGKTGLWIDNEYTIVKASGSFKCNRIVKTAL